MSMHIHKCFSQTYNLKQGLKKFGQEGYDATYKEIGQMHGRGGLSPVKLRDLSDEEARKALETVTIMLRKKNGTVKTRTCANGSVQRNWMSKEDVASPTAAPESVMLTSLADAIERRYVVSCDIPNAFIQADVDVKPGDPRIVLIIRGILAEMLCKLAPDVYTPYMEEINGQKVLYLIVHKAIYGMIQSPLLWYKKIRADLESQGFKVNPYDPCVANKWVDGSYLTVLWHVDDLKISHKKEKVVDDFVNWVYKKYTDENGEVKICKGKQHLFLGILFDYSIEGMLQVNMTDYVKEMIGDFEELYKIGDSTECPWTERLFKVDEQSPLLEPEQAETFHTYVAKGLFLCQRARPDIQPAIIFLCSRVKAPTEQDWKKLLRLMKFLKGTPDVVLRLQADSFDINWYWDASFAVHEDYVSHTGGTMTMGKGSVLSSSRKQKLNTRSSTEAELVAVDDGMSIMLWTKLFLEAQGHKVESNVLHQDNKSSILLQKNGKASSSKRTRHINIRYFFITDQIKKGNIQLKYCPTDQMIADYFTKPLTGTQFYCLWKLIMNPQCKGTGDSS